MLKTYCSECGSPNFYTEAKPKFCTNCGTAFYTTVVKEKTTNLKSNKSIINKQKPAEEDDEDDMEEDEDQEATPIPDISGLDVDISFEKPRKDSLGSIAGTVPDAFSYTGERLDTKVSAKEVLKQIKKESSTLRPK
jgi:uncharacterized Zn finger protein (UPF0148 family)